MASLTLGDLIERLSDLAADHGEDIEVLVAYQQSWPLAGTLDALTVLDARDDDGSAAPVLWLAVGGSPEEHRSPYAPAEAWSA